MAGKKVAIKSPLLGSHLVSSGRTRSHEVNYDSLTVVFSTNQYYYCPGALVTLTVTPHTSRGNLGYIEP